MTTSRILACYQTRKTPDFAPTQQFAMHTFFLSSLPPPDCRIITSFMIRGWSVLSNGGWQKGKASSRGSYSQGATPTSPQVLPLNDGGANSLGRTTMAEVLAENVSWWFVAKSL